MVTTRVDVLIEQRKMAREIDAHAATVRFGSDEVVVADAHWKLLANVDRLAELALGGQS